jgi:serine protease Do
MLVFSGSVATSVPKENTMKRFARFVLFFSVFFFAAGLAGTAPAGGRRSPSLPEGTSPSVREAVDGAIARVYPALVRIEVVFPEFDEGRTEKIPASGSGVIISDKGHVVTNYHVAGKAIDIRCTLPGGEKLNATLVGADALSDIAVVRLDGIEKLGKLPTARFGNSDEVQVGETVLAMGSPLALSQSVTLGIVSNVRMTIPEFFWPFKFTLEGEEVGSLVRWLGHDAPIFPGNSGGPLVNLKGEIIGINEIGLGLGGAIPANLAREVATQLVETGSVRRSWIGTDIQPLLRGSGNTEGVLVAGVIPGSPAAAAGIEPGDIILSYDGQGVDVRFPEQIPHFNRLVFDTPVGRTVPVVLLRDGKKIDVSVKTEERGLAQAKEEEILAWGMTAEDLSAMAARERKRPNTEGVLVETIRPGKGADDAKPPLKPDDVILEMAGKKIKNLQALKDETDRLLKDGTGPLPVLVSFDREGQMLMTVVRIGLQPPEEPQLEARKAWVPVYTQVLTRQLADALNLPGKTGVRITYVIAKSSAAEAGLKPGDLVLAVDGDSIPAFRPEDTEVFDEMIRQYRIGTEVKLSVIRGSETLEIPVRLVKNSLGAREMPFYQDEILEFTARDVSEEDRVDNQWSQDIQGAIVSDVKRGSWADLAHLAVGDLIMAVDGRTIKNIAGLEQVLKEKRPSRPERIVFFVRRGIHTLFIQMEPERRP